MNELPPFPVGDRPEIGQVADWVELAALSRKAMFKRGDLKSAISREDLASPELIEQEAWDELVKRATWFGSRWPLRMDGSVLRKRKLPADRLALYRFMLLFSLDVEPEDRVLFEMVVAALIARFGTSTKGLRIGHPARSGMDTSFRNRVDTYAKSSGLLPPELPGAPLPHDKDLGVDAVTWFAFEDGRGCYLHFVTQCATGSDWDQKLHELNLDVWSRHVHWAVTPVRVFAVPYVVSLPEAYWVRTSDKGGLILDRPRLFELADGVDLPGEEQHAVARRVKELSEA